MSGRHERRPARATSRGTLLTRREIAVGLLEDTIFRFRVDEPDAEGGDNQQAGNHS